MKANSLGKKIVTGNSAEKKAGGLVMGNNSAILQAQITAMRAGGQKQGINHGGKNQRNS